MNPFQTNTVQPQNRFTPSMFMTPQGNVYVIDSPLEVANVPMGTSLSVAICPNESLMYCMWDTTHEMMMEWYSSIKQKIEKF